MTNINPMPELETLAKQLRMSGLIESIGQHNKLAIEHKLTYPEFLALLLQDELLRREQKKFNTRIKRAGYRADKTIESFDFLYNPKINERQIRDVASCHFVKEKSCVLIVGPCGTGKSHLAQAIGHCAAQANIDALFTTQSNMLKSLQAARATGTYERRMRALIKYPLLIIDDFGLKPLKPPMDEDFHDVISERYEKAATIITSNLDYEEWIQAFPNRLLGMATLDRLRHGATMMVLDGKSYRSFKDDSVAGNKKKNTASNHAKND